MTTTSENKPTQQLTDSEKTPITKKGTSNRGFASMDYAKQREIASKGGKAAHASGHAHEFTSEEARLAGRKGGQAAHESGRAHEFTSEEARAAGRKGGQASHGGGRSQAHKDQSQNPPEDDALRSSSQGQVRSTAHPV